MSAGVLQVEGLSVRLPPGADRAYAAEDVSFQVSAGEVLCLVGESGSGKSMTAAAILRLLPPGVAVSGGRVALDGQDLARLDARAMRRIRGARIGMVFQDPMAALNPLHRVGRQVGEVFRTHARRLERAEVRRRVQGLLERVGLPDPPATARAYPHELSGGQRQRVGIAMALALEPALLIADEPTTALDVTTQAGILALLAELRARTGMAVLFVTHDFGVVAEVADRVAVMRQGRIVEQGPTRQVLDRPQHPYTRALVGAVPPLIPSPARLQARPAAALEAVLEVTGLSRTYRSGGGPFSRRRRRTVVALDDVSLSLPRGATLGVVGESGSGKSTLARCVVRLLQPDRGSVRLGGADLLGLPRLQAARRVQMVFQDPYASLNPRRRVGELVAQGLVVHGAARDAALRRTRELLAMVALDPASAERYPHEFSGGQRQRIALARALALEPEVLVADEPVSALDVSVQAQVLALLRGLRDRLGLSMLFVTHDLRVAAQVCDRIAVMQRGRVVEEGTAADVLLRPRAEYTRALLAAVPGRGWTPPPAATADPSHAAQRHAAADSIP